MKEVHPVPSQIVPKSDSYAQYFTFYCTPTPLCSVRCLAAGPLVLTNVTFFVLDADLATDELLMASRFLPPGSWYEDAPQAAAWEVRRIQLFHHTAACSLSKRQRAHDHAAQSIRFASERNIISRR